MSAAVRISDQTSIMLELVAVNGREWVEVHTWAHNLPGGLSSCGRHRIALERFPDVVETFRTVLADLAAKRLLARP